MHCVLVHTGLFSSISPEVWKDANDRFNWLNELSYLTMDTASSHAKTVEDDCMIHYIEAHVRRYF